MIIARKNLHYLEYFSDRFNYDLTDCYKALGLDAKSFWKRKKSGNRLRVYELLALGIRFNISKARMIESYAEYNASY